MTRKQALMLGGLPLLVLVTTPALAQDAPADSGGITEIVVTAQKKAENLQSVPISVAAVGGAAISNLAITTLQGLQGAVPNVQIDNFANTPNNAVFSIRGIGVIEPDPYAGNTVSIVVDGVPQFFSMGALIDTYDVSRVEILRGPQGTLFGANTTGGVVNVVSTQPKGEFGGYIKVTGGNYARFDVNGAIEIPLAKDLVSFRLAGIHTQRHGWVTNVWNGKPMGNKDVTAIRPQLLITPSPDLKITLQGEYVRARNGAPVVVNGGQPGEANYVPAGTNWNGSVLPMYVSPCATPNQPCVAPGHYYSGNNEVPDQSNMDTEFGVGTINWNNTALGNLTSITGIKHFVLFEYTDQDGTAKTNNATRRRTEGKQFSQELRDDFRIGDNLSGTVGAFYMHTHYDHYQMYHLDFALPGYDQFNQQFQSTDSISAFAQTYYRVTDALKLSAGIRFTHDSIDARSTLDAGLNAPALTSPNWAVVQVNFLPGGPLDLRNGPHALDVGGKKSWNNVGWKLGADYTFGTNRMVYASWARGFKSGGYTGRIGVAADGDTPYNPEKVDTFEVGVKADVIPRRVRFNLAGFYTSYRDMQVAEIYYDSATRVQGNRILNAAKSRIYGFEAETQIVPTEGLTLRGSLAYLNAKYKQFLYNDPVSGAVVNLAGFDLQNAPHWAGTIGANYTLPLQGDSKIVADVAWMYTGKKFYTAITDTPRSTVQATSLVDGTLTWHSAGDRFSFGIWVKNLFDNRYISTVYDSPGYMGLVGYAPPRQFGASAQANF
ncbi:MAG: TonB-dependent receptor [Sphingomonadales bacterium]|nr:TonB-dependent receptor [Sphingomonadales bacterium]